jgi:hypothetical protein
MTKNYEWFNVRHLRPPLWISTKGYIVLIALFVYNTNVPIYRVYNKYKVWLLNLYDLITINP